MHPRFNIYILYTCFVASSVTSEGQRSLSLDHKPVVKIDPLSSLVRVKDSREYKDGKQKSKQGPLPDPVFISSTIRINNGGHPGHHPPNGRTREKELNKRQIFVQDPSQLAELQQSGQSQPTFYYTPPSFQPDPSAGSLYGSQAPMQIQTVTALPLMGQTAGQPVYLLQPSQQPYTLAQGQKTPQFTAFQARTGDSETTSGQDSSSVPQPKVTIVSHADPNAQQDSSKREPTSVPKSQQQIQYEEAQQVLQNIIKQQALQQTQQQRQQQFQLAQQIQQQFTFQAQQQAAQAQLDAQLQSQQQQPAEAESQNQILLSPSQGPAQQQIIQIEHAPAQAQVPAQRVYQTQNGQTFILHQKPALPSQPESGDRTAHVQQGSAAPGGNFVIRHQTYVAGPGGQMFTVPVPVPAEQTDGSSEDRSNERRSEETPGDGGRRTEEKSREEGNRREGSQQHPPRHPPPHRPINSFMRRFMQAFSVRGDASERVGTNIALPILASTGVFFGLGALAAGWYLSNANREVGILRRTGKPVPPGTNNVKRIRRHLPPPPPEVDQATFFQTIIQQAIEKQQEQFDPPEPEPVNNFRPTEHHGRKPAQRHDLEIHEETSPNSKVQHKHRPVKKSWNTRQAINFAKVAIPAIVLGGAVIAIIITIIWWYLTGSNREIAFLEPSAYSRRRKRDITTTALADGWFHRVLTAIHGNPYDNHPATTDLTDMIDPFGDTSKGNIDYHANISDAVVAVSLAVIAFFSLLGIVFAWLAAQNEKSLLGIEGPYGFGGWPGYRRAKRSFTSVPSKLDELLVTFEQARDRVPKMIRKMSQRQ